MKMNIRIGTYLDFIISPLISTISNSIFSLPLFFFISSIRNSSTRITFCFTFNFSFNETISIAEEITFLRERSRGVSRFLQFDLPSRFRHRIELESRGDVRSTGSLHPNLDRRRSDVSATHGSKSGDGPRLFSSPGYSIPLLIVQREAKFTFRM